LIIATRWQEGRGDIGKIEQRMQAVEQDTDASEAVGKKIEKTLKFLTSTTIREERTQSRRRSRYHRRMTVV
jgi:hypothetical protein